MKRRLFNLLARAGQVKGGALTALTAVSLVMCVATVALWIRQPFNFVSTFFPFGPHVTPEQERARMALYGNSGPETQWFLGTDDGRFIFRRFHCGEHALPTVWQRSVGGFGVGEGISASASGQYPLSSVRWYAVPIWPIALASAFLPALATRGILLRFRARLRRQRGECPACGYDLRASKERCPECGTPIAETRTHTARQSRP
jgi:predicted RNA-binding Zn-ribbon protein involved in translation (DUF1610 family)